MEQNLPKTCQTHFEDPNKLHSFWLTITPDEGYWHGGRFKFRVDVPDEYNIVVSWTVLFPELLACFSFFVLILLVKNPYFGVQGHPWSLNSMAIESHCMTSY